MWIVSESQVQGLQQWHRGWHRDQYCSTPSLMTSTRDKVRPQQISRWHKTGRKGWYARQMCCPPAGQGWRNGVRGVSWASVRGDAKSRLWGGITAEGQAEGKQLCRGGPGCWPQASKVPLQVRRTLQVIRKMIARRLREVIPPLYSALVRLIQRASSEGFSSNCTNTWREGMKKRDPCSSQWCPPTEENTMDTNWNTRDSI